MSDAITRLNTALEGRYRIDRELGEGGMATVYLADDLRHERKVALKVLKPELAAVVGAERFLAEIKTTANLQHPHILPLFDSGEAGSFLFYVMPYVEGETLRERIDRDKQLPVDEAVRIATAVANALQVAHDQGIVHRDIKPANILISRGEPLVADFGIALAVGAAGGSRLTETGLSIGTPFYMSPEQATGDQQVGPPSDTYALAAVLYEMLTGDPPYIGSTAQAVLGKIIQGAPVSATAVRKAIPPNVDAALRRALEKLPADRFPEASAFAKALGDPGFRYGQAPGVTMAADVGRWRTVAMGATTVAAAAVLTLGWALTRPAPSGPVTRVSVKMEPDQDFFLVRGVLTLSDDGSTMAYEGRSETGGTRVWIRRWDALDATPIRDTEGAVAPSLSPDGREVAFGMGPSIRVVPLDGGVSRTLAEGAACCPTWGPAGEWVYFMNDSSGLSRVPARGGPTEVITRVNPAADEFDVFADVLPGGERLLYTAVRPEAVTVRAFDLESGESKDLTPGTTPRYSLSGHLLFMAPDEGTLLAAPFDPGRLELTGPASPVAEGVLRTAQPWPYYDLSETGRLVYRTGSASGLVTPVWVERDGTERVVDPSWTFQADQNLVSVALSPDGERAAVSITDRDGTTDLWIKELDDGPLFRLTFEGTENLRARWSADGEFVTFVSNRAGDRDLWRKRADGSGPAELVLDRERPIQDGLFSPDGEWIVFVESDGGTTGAGIYAIRQGIDGEATALVTSGTRAHEISLSPDGRWLAHTWNQDGDIQVYVRPFPDVNAGRWQVSTVRGDEPVWARSGGELFYQGTSSPGDQMVAEILTDRSFAVGRQEPLFPLANYLIGNGRAQYDVGPDDQRLLMFKSADLDNQLVLVDNVFELLRER